MKLSWIPYLILAFALLLTGLATRYVATTTDSRERLGFARTTESIELHLQARMATYIALLRATRGLFVASDAISQDEFARFFSELRLTDQFKGTLGIGYSMRVPPEQKDALVAARRAEGAPDFRIWPEVPGIEEHSIAYLQPHSRANLVALGYNMFTEPTRREAMVTARDTGSPILSGRVSLVQEIGEKKEPGFLIYFPVYEGRSTPQTLTARRERLEGFVYSPFRASDLLRTVASAREARDVSYAIYDGGSTQPGVLLYRSPDFTSSKMNGGHLRSESYISVARRTWTIEFLSTETFDSHTDRHIAPLTAYAGGLVSLLMFAATLSLARARVRAEEVAGELAISREEAQTANRLKDEFLATVSHELRTPLNAISGWTQLLMEEENADAETRKGLAIIARNTRALASLVDELLDVSRIISGRLQLHSGPVDFVRIVEDAIETVQPAASARQIGIECEFPDSAPLTGDASRLQQVVWNLLSNSIKFSPTGSWVAVAIERQGAEFELRVTDHGKGISADFIDHVFSPFRQADSGSTRQQGGLGLGLAIVKRLVELHGGSVAVTSEGDGQGAVFRVRLPVRAAEAESGEAVGRELSPPGEPSPPPSIAGARVLLVEDEDDTRSMMEALLTQRGALVQSAASAAEALALLPEITTDVLVSDIGMPGMDGLEMMRQIRRQFPAQELPAIAVTAYATRADRDRALESGFDEHVPKPVDPAQLQCAIARLWRRTE